MPNQLPSLCTWRKQNNHPRKRKAAADKRFASKWALNMKQVQQTEEDGCLQGDASERAKQHRLRQMKGVCGKSQSDREHGNAGCCGADHFERTCDVLRDSKAHQDNSNA